MLYVNGPGFAGLYAGDSVEFLVSLGAARNPVRTNKTARVIPLLVFADHVQVSYGPNGHTVDASNFVRLVRRGRRHIQADGVRETLAAIDPRANLAGADPAAALQSIDGGARGKFY